MTLERQRRCSPTKMLKVMMPFGGRDSGQPWCAHCSFALTSEDDDEDNNCLRMFRLQSFHRLDFFFCICCSKVEKKCFE